MMDDQYQGMYPNGNSPWGQQGPGQQTSSFRPPVGSVPGPDGQLMNGYDSMNGYDPMGGYAQPQGGSPADAPQDPYAAGAYPPPYDGTAQQPPYVQMPPMGPGMQEEQPPAGFPPQMEKPMKRRVRLSLFQVAVVVVALSLAGVYVFLQFSPETAQYGEIQSGSLSATHAGDCLIVRNEIPYDSEGVTSIAYDAAEGSRVVRQDYICKVYSSSYSTREMNTLQNYRTQIRNYQKTLIENESTYDAKRVKLSSEVLSCAKQVRSMLAGARGSLMNQQRALKTAIDNRQTFLKQKYASDQRFNRFYDDERSQTQRIDSWTKQITASMDGIVSFYSDGYEYFINAQNYDSFTPQRIRELFNGQNMEKSSLQKTKTTIYRLIKDDGWYALFLSNSKDWNPVKGEQYELQLERFEETQTLATVVNFTRSGGELLVCLRVDSPVQSVLYMRTCQATLGENMAMLMVPERAICRQDDTTGVMIVDGQTESFIPVNVIHTEDGDAYFQPIQQGLLFEGMVVRLF